LNRHTTNPAAAARAQAPAPRREPTAAAAAEAALAPPHGLRCEARLDPLGIDAERPRLSWLLDPAVGRRAGQLLAQVHVAPSVDDLTDPQRVLWQSTPIPADQPPWVIYDGPPLRSRQRCVWAVRLFDPSQDKAVWSQPARWEMGLLQSRDWHARWIGPAKAQETACPRLARRFELTTPAAHARVYVTALGLYELFINGRRVGDDRLTPGWTDYHRRIAYQVYDVTALLRPGANVLGLELAEGWYCGLLGWTSHGRREQFGAAPPRGLVQLEWDEPGGRRQTLASDERWVCWPQTPTRSSLYLGECYDAGRDQTPWCDPDQPGRAPDADASAVRVYDAPGAALVAQPEPPIRVIGELAPASITRPRPGLWVVDFGQNFAGVCRLRARGPAGTTITLRHAELLHADGTVDARNLRRAVSIDRWTLAGDGEEAWSPRFTYHGFRYVQIEGYPGPLRREDVVGLIVHTDATPTLDFDCDDPLLLRIHDNCAWTLRSNLHGLITDCPQRDERFGWLGDGSAILPTAGLQFDLHALLTKAARDIRDAQHDDGSLPDYAPFVALGEEVTPSRGSPGYMDGIVLFPWNQYWLYGETRALRDGFDAVQRYLRYIEQHNPDGLWRQRRGNNYGDWLAADERADKTAVATLLWRRCAVVAARAARALDRPDDAAALEHMARRVRDAFNRAYLEGGRYRLQEQSILAMALAFGVAPRSCRRAVAEDLRHAVSARGHRLSTGIFGTAVLLNVLSAHGHHETALRVARQTEAPSWGHMVRQGATTMWERWYADRLDAGMNSRNHPALGSVGQWLVRWLAGIEPTAAGFASARLRPGYVPGLAPRRARAQLQTVRGRWVCGWSAEPAQRPAAVALELTVPPGVRAELHLPPELGLDRPKAVARLGRVAGLTPRPEQAGTLCYGVAPGTYQLDLPCLPTIASPSGLEPIIPPHAPLPRPTPGELNATPPL